MRTADRPAPEEGMKTQGDHVLPFSIVERGFLRHFRVNLSNFSGLREPSSAQVAAASDDDPLSVPALLEDEEHLDEASIDVSLGAKRDKIVGFVEHLLVLEEHSHRLLYGAVPPVLASSGGDPEPGSGDAVLPAASTAGASPGEAVAGFDEELDDTAVVEGGAGKPAAPDSEGLSAGVKGREISKAENYFRGLLDTYRDTRIRKTHLQAKLAELQDPETVADYQRPQDRNIKRIIASVDAAIAGLPSDLSEEERVAAVSEEQEKGITSVVTELEKNFVSGNRQYALLSLKGKLYLSLKDEGELKFDNVKAIAEESGLDLRGRIKGEVKSSFFGNKLRVIKLCEELSESAGAYYNRLPGVAYNRSKAAVPPPADRLSEKEALEYLDARFGGASDEGLRSDWCDPLTSRFQRVLKENTDKLAELEGLPDTEKAPRTRSNKTVAKRREELKKEVDSSERKLADGVTFPRILEALFDYPEVEAESTSGKVGERTNDVGLLSFYMARLAYVLSGSYPEMLKKYEPAGLDSDAFYEECMQPFVEKELAAYWPSVNASLAGDYKGIHDLVREKITILSKARTDALKKSLEESMGASGRPPYSSSEDERAVAANHGHSPDEDSEDSADDRSEHDVDEDHAHNADEDRDYGAEDGDSHSAEGDDEHSSEDDEHSAADDDHSVEEEHADMGEEDAILRSLSIGINMAIEEAYDEQGIPASSRPDWLQSGKRVAESTAQDAQAADLREEPEADGNEPEADGKEPEADGKEPEADGKEPGIVPQ